MIQNKDFYKIRSQNYHYQLIVIKEKLINSKNEFKKIRQVNEKLQQEINELKIINEIISFQRQKCSSRSISSTESERQNILNTNASISIKKSTKHFDFESFINHRENFK